MKIRNILIAFLPFNWMRVNAYRYLNKNYFFGKNVKVGFGTIIDIEHSYIHNNTKIGLFNQFKKFNELYLGSDVEIKNFNTFRGSSWTKGYDLNTVPDVSIGTKSYISSHHLFDVIDSITIGCGNWIAGRGSEFWTHGNMKEGFIFIGSHNYIGSRCIFLPDSGVFHKCIVAAGSVVTKNFGSGNNKVLIAGNPAVIKKRGVKVQKR